MPETTIDTQTEILPRQTMFDPAALLAEQMRRCHHAALECFSVLDREGFDARTQMAAVKLGAKLVKSSLELARVLRGGEGNEVRHRFIYEHTSPHPKNRQTNSGVEDGEARDG